MTTFDQARPLRQSMNWLHTWSGLLLGWLLFAIFVTGTLSYFRNEITFWMQAELHRAQPVPTEKIAFVRALALLAREAPDAQQWTLTLPSPRNPTLGLGWQSPTATPAANERPGRGSRQREEGIDTDALEGVQAPDSVAENRPFSDGTARERPNRGEAGERRGSRQRESGIDPEGAQAPDSARENRSFSNAAARERPNRGEARGERGERREGFRRESGPGMDDTEDAQTPDFAAGSRPFSADAPRERPNRGEALATNRAQPEAGRPAEVQRPGAGAQRQGQGGGRRGPRLVLDPASGDTLEGRTTAGGNFLYRFHFELYGMDRIWARWIVGIATMFMFVALVSGAIVHRRIFKDFFTFRSGKGKRSWMDAHNISSVLSLPFHLVITFSSLVLFGHMLIPSAQQSAYRGDSEAYFTEMRARMIPSSAMPQPSGERAPLTDLAALAAAAQDAWNGKRVGSIAITHPGDRNAVIEMRQMNFPGLTGGRNIPALRFDGVTGEPLPTPPLREPSLIQAIGSALNLLHRGFFATPVPRWLLFLSGVGGSLMIASGLIVWSVSRARKTSAASAPARAPWGHRLVEVLNVAAIAGLMVAIAVHFWASRLIPADLPARADWEIRAFFIAWALTLVHAALRRPKKAAWVEQLACAGALFALLPLVNAATGGLALPGSIARGLWLLAGFDLCALVSGAALFFAARKVHRHIPRARLASSPSGEESALGPETEPGASLPTAEEEAA
jgi:uncharacterized iron-regulated membrane protein